MPDEINLIQVISDWINPVWRKNVASVAYSVYRMVDENAEMVFYG